MKAPILLTAAALLALSMTTTARADNPPRWAFDQDQQHPFDLSLVGNIGQHFGGGVIAGIPVAPRGFSSKINDAFYIEIEGGAGAHPRSSWSGSAYVLAGVRYQLYLFDWFAPYLTGRGGIWVPFATGVPKGTGYGAIGAMFLFNEHIALRLEGGYGGRIGVTFRF
jgi:hypothetical protein